MSNSLLYVLFSADLQEMKNVKMIDQPTKWYFANVHFERNIIAPWPQCYVKEANSKPNGNQNDTIVISDNDSDDDDASTCKLHEILVHKQKTVFLYKNDTFEELSQSNDIYYHS